MDKPRVYVTRRMPDEPIERLRKSCDVEEWDKVLPPPRTVLSERIKGIDGLLCSLTERIDAEMLRKAHNLRVISNYAVGFENIDVAEATRRGIAVGNTPDVLTDTTADFAFALMTSAARRVAEADRAVREGKWRTWDPLGFLGGDIHGATLGIIGLGRIGKAVARRGKGFDMRILYYDEKRQPDAEQALGIRFAPLREVLAKSDFVSIHTNLTPRTRHLIDAKRLSLMKKTAILVNTARGPIVDITALYDSLKNKKLGAAALDVTDPEPLPSDHRLLALNNVTVTPHIASATLATRSRMAQIAVDNLLAGLRGKPLPHSVNPKVRPHGQGLIKS